MSSPEGSSAIKRALAVRLIAERTRRPDKSVRQSRSRVSHAISSAIATGKLHLLIDGTINFGDLATWAQEYRPGEFSDWPARPRISRGHIAASLDGVTGEATGVKMPHDLATCHEDLVQVYRQVSVLRRENKLLQQEVVALRPYKVARDELRKKLSKVAQQKRPRQR